MVVRIEKIISCAVHYSKKRITKITEMTAESFHVKNSIWSFLPRLKHNEFCKETFLTLHGIGLLCVCVCVCTCVCVCVLERECVCVCVCVYMCMRVGC